jgi:hypothetical protein
MMPDTVGRKVQLHVGRTWRDVGYSGGGAIVGGVLGGPVGSAGGTRAGLGVSRHNMDNFHRALAPPAR